MGYTIADSRVLFVASWQSDQTEGKQAMDWELISAVSDFVAAVVVVISLLYLARQVRDSNNEVRVENISRATDGLNAIFMSIAQDEDLSRIFHVGLVNPESLTRDERPRLFTLLSIIVGRYGDVFSRYQRGSLEEGNWIGCKNHLEYIVNTPAGLLWIGSGSLKHAEPDYREFVESLCLKPAKSNRSGSLRAES